jgi:hypothetical protein
VVVTAVVARLAQVQLDHNTPQHARSPEHQGAACSMLHGKSCVYATAASIAGFGGFEAAEQQHARCGVSGCSSSASTWKRQKRQQQYNAMFPSCPCAFTATGQQLQCWVESPPHTTRHPLRCNPSDSRHS